MLAPERIIQVGGSGVTLRGDLFAAMEYAEITEGDSLEDAFLKLRPAIEAQERGERLKGMFDPTIYVDLIYAFSAYWRDESGWNRRTAEDGDAERPLRKRGPYKAMLKALPHHAFRELRPKIFGQLIQTIYPPEAAAEKNGEAQRSEDSSPEKNETGAMSGAEATS